MIQSTKHLELPSHINIFCIYNPNRIDANNTISCGSDLENVTKTPFKHFISQNNNRHRLLIDLHFSSNPDHSNQQNFHWQATRTSDPTHKTTSEQSAAQMLECPNWVPFFFSRLCVYMGMVYVIYVLPFDSIEQAMKQWTGRQPHLRSRTKYGRVEKKSYFRCLIISL